ncbi:enoyl-CoA hydratase/isomerase family protein [Salibacterium aidingense]|uniref:enoyl-CoA hydratase/isomerase family protein n=1 Tax=Salibacterium aidingense TaxID=384933 RepID=UPI003BE3C40E
MRKYNHIDIDKKENTAWITLNDPKTLNALSSEMVVELDHAVRDVETDPSMKVILFTGTGKAFIAGADIEQMKSLDPLAAVEFSERTTNLYKKIEDSSKVYIAAVNGFALGGGCELSLACDLRVASEKAKFGLPETSLGIIPGGAGTQRLPRLVGPGAAKEIIFTGDMISAERAYEIGLVNKVVKPEHLISEGSELAAKILKNGATAIRFAKKSMNKGMELDIEIGTELEKNLFGLCFATEDQKEGMTAFVEKRPAVFTKE